MPCLLGWNKHSNYSPDPTGFRLLTLSLTSECVRRKNIPIDKEAFENEPPSGASTNDRYETRASNQIVAKSTLLFMSDFGKFYDPGRVISQVQPKYTFYLVGNTSSCGCSITCATL